MHMARLLHASLRFEGESDASKAALDRKKAYALEALSERYVRSRDATVAKARVSGGACVG
jgi:hypothetical protein